MSARSHILFATVSIIALSSSAHADDQATLAPEVVVSATGVPTPAGEVASSVTVIDRQQIEDSQKETVSDLLDEVPGLAVARSGGIGQPTSVFIRGANSAHTLVIIDGIEVNDPTDPADAYNFAYLTTDNIDRIEVLRGPESTLYGSEAIGGVVIITTKAGVGAPHGYASAEGGTYNTSRYAAGNSGEVDRFNYSLGISDFSTGGIPDFSHKLGGEVPDPNTNQTASANLGAQLTDNFSAHLVGRYTEASARYDGFGSESLEDRTRNTQYNLRGSGDLSLYDGAWTQEFGLGTYHTWRDFFSDDAFTPPYSKDIGSRDKADWTNHVKIMPGNTFTFGLADEEEDFTSDSSSRVSTNTKSALAQDQFQIGKSFFTSIGGRVDDQSTFGTAETWRIAPAYLIQETGTKLKATIGTGFKAPVLFELFSPTYGNPNLQPERSKGEDAGFEQRIWGDKVTFGSTAFWNQIKDLIDYDFATNKYFNIDQAHTRGLENTLTLRPIAGLTLAANYTYMQTEDNGTHSQLLRRPKNEFSATADYKFAEGRADVQSVLRAVGSRQDIDLNFDQVSNPSFYTIDVNASYQLFDHVKVYGRIENLLNRQYMEVYGYGSPGFGSFAGLKVDY